jgi:2-methylcitrate synthase/citrate synthase II
MKTEAYSPGLEGVIAGITHISNVDPERQSLMYRGYDIRDLAEHSTFEEVAYLLIYGDLPTAAEFTAFKNTLISEREIPQGVVDVLKLLPKQSHPMDLLRTGVATLALHDPELDDNSHEANVRKAVRMTAKFPALIAKSYRLSIGKETIKPDNSLSHSENFLYMLTGEKPDAFVAKIVDISLICYAEHGFNASTFSARVTASTLSDLHSAIVSAIGTLKGPLHGGANEEAMKMLLEIKTPENAEAWIKDALATKKKIMGFGHREYKSGDPRAAILKDYGRQLGDKLGQPHWYKMADIIEDAMFRDKGLKPNVDFPTAYIYYMMNLPINIYTPIFAIARITGWAANVIEQLDNNRLFRPKAEYDGPRHKDYLPLAQRG